MEEILQSKAYITLVSRLADKLEMSEEEVGAEAKLYLKELHSEQEDLIHTVGIHLAEYILGRGYEDTIDVDPVQMKLLGELMRDNSIAFVMTHKTYIDMFVLGVVLARHGLPLPYIFAGINMAFVGMGQLGRKAGAIFIRRSIKDNEIYKSILRLVISEHVNRGSHFMWAIEGTRSRTGKLVWPKMGILKYISEAEQESRRNVKYVPVSIVYDLIPDVEDMTREGRGKTKSQESLLWFTNYVRKMGNDFGKISIRIGNPIDLKSRQLADVSNLDDSVQKESVSSFALELMHGINEITPVTTTSLLFTALLSKFALTKRAAEHVVLDLMKLISEHRTDCLVDRGKKMSQSIQASINLLLNSGYIQQIGDGIEAKYSIVPAHYLNASYYANMCFHHLYHRAFIELALVKVIQANSKDRISDFWTEVMKLRDQFKFEFFYSHKSKFSDEIELDFKLMHEDWESLLHDPEYDLRLLLKDQRVFVSQVVLSTFIEAYRVVAQTLLSLEEGREYNERQLLRYCLFLGEEMHWKGQIHRIDSVSKPFILNGIRYAQNRKLVPHAHETKTEAIELWLTELMDLANRLKELQEFIVIKQSRKNLTDSKNPLMVPGSKSANFTSLLLEGPSGPQVGAFFDLDRTLIADFSAKQFFQTRMLSGKMGAKEIVAQFAGALVYGVGNKNFAGLAAIGAKGVKGIEEKVFIEVGEEVYLKHLSKAIYPESRALVEAHLEKGHTVAIISAATPYQVNPIARDLNIEHIMCTRMEVEGGKFTGEIIDPPCWGEGKAQAAMTLAETYNLDLRTSYFYTDSVSDLPLLEIIGYPRPVNPDAALSAIAYENDWPIFRFDDAPRPGLAGLVRTGMAFGSLIPAAISGMARGTQNLSWKEGINSMTSVVGDLGTFLAGIKLVIKDEKFLWAQRPAVFIFNHQSNVDLLIMAKLLRKDAVGIAKQELKYSPIGPFLQAAGVIFVDRKDKEKAIEALKPAVDALKNGTSIGIAPEGTRSYDYKLGVFKKGAFHLAMQAGVPIVPVVIKNAHDAMPRGSNLIRPSVVEVKILKPIPTKNWKRVDLDKNIKRVRSKYLKTLGQK